MIIALLINIFILLFMPIPLMWIQWHLDNTIFQSYSSPWKLKQLDGNSRAYHQHLVNHAFIGMCANWTALAGCVIDRRLYWFGIAIFITGKLYPFIKEFWYDPVHLGKPLNDRDWRERLFGDLCVSPLFVLASIYYFR